MQQGSSNELADPSQDPRVDSAPKARVTVAKRGFAAKKKHAGQRSGS